MKNNWNEHYLQCNESIDQTHNFKYYETDSNKRKKNKSKWREIEIIKEQQRLRRELMDLLDYS